MEINNVETTPSNLNMAQISGFQNSLNSSR